MMRVGRSLTAWRLCFLAFALIAVGIRIAAPSGYMLAAGEKPFQITIALCSKMGAVGVLDLGSDKPPAPTTDADHACAFAVAAQPGAPTAGAVLAAPHGGQAIDVAAAQADLRPGRGLAAPPPWQTGPPSHA